ncbi:MAG: 50S ribosomal protein L11 methyltransferase [Blastocatellia bacterium]|nr:50S ribosomal protein L11 methyltransferase [Blastocatellia bacterium]
MDDSAEKQAWFSISVTVAPEVTESIEYAFNSLDSLGTAINQLHKKNAERITVVGYFQELPDEERFQDELHYALRSYGFTEEAVLQVERAEIEDINWLAEWKRHWKPTDVGSFVIAPPWSETDETKIVIRIEPNMAFGTGTHETTQLCLQAIEKYYSPGDSFLDVGTGTGILAIAAAKLNLISKISRFRSVACDTDVDSIAIAIENAKLNGVGGMIDLYVGSIDDKTPIFDFVCANLTLDVIKPILPLLIQKSGKTLVMSGILMDQKGEIVDALADLGITGCEIEQAGEWIGVVSVNSE